MKTIATALLVAFSMLCLVSANFDIYSVSEADWLDSNGFQYRYMIFRADPDCKEVLGGTAWLASSDVSGIKEGVRCGPAVACDDQKPETIDVMEMNFHATHPVYHWTIYKNRGYDMYGLDGKVYGTCIPFPGDDFQCQSIGFGLRSVGGVRLFRCLTQFTSDDITKS